MEPETNNKSLESIFEDFISTLDDAIGTFKATKKENKRVNQLLFSYIVNNFDSFISECLNASIFLVPEIKEKYFKKGKKEDSNVTIREILKINTEGLENWIVSVATYQLDSDLRNKRHAERFETLIENYKINNKKRYVCLSGGGAAFASGCLKKNPTPKNKRSVNHQTTSEEIVGYADIIYEKRNAITHNRGKYTDKIIQRLNETWALKIKDNRPVIKRGTIKSSIRFYAALCIFILEESPYINFEKDDFIGLFEKIKKIENIKISSGVQDKFAIRRKEFLEKYNKERFTTKTYKEKFSVSYATASRDIAKYKNDSAFEVKQGGKGSGYSIKVK